MATATEVLSALMLGGLMGLVGQGARSIVGLRKMNQEADKLGVSAGDLFTASRLVVSLFIGFIAGVLATIALGIGKLIALNPDDLQLLLGIAAAGYAGADFIEGFSSRLIKTPDDATTAAKVAASQPMQPETAAAGFIDARPTMRAEVALTPRPTAFAPQALHSEGSLFARVTPEMVKRMFVPATPIGNIRTHLPHVLDGLAGAGLADRSMLLMALATIRAETEGFVPIDEFRSPFNTSRTPFDKYEPGTSAGKKLKNTQPGDGARFKGRGFIQLTGRDNYGRVGSQLHLDLLANPGLANEPTIAGKILAQFLLNNEGPIREALRHRDLQTARVLVNGGHHGQVQFDDAFTKGEAILPTADDSRMA